MAAPGYQQEIFSSLKTELPAQLPAYLKKQRWFGAKAREILSTQVLDVIPLQGDGCDALLVLVKVEYQGGGADLYSVPLLRGEGAGRTSDDSSPRLRVAGSKDGENVELSDALQDEAFLSLLLEAIQKDRVFKGEGGELRASHTSALSQTESENAGKSTSPGDQGGAEQQFHRLRRAFDLEICPATRRRN